MLLSLSFFPSILLSFTFALVFSFFPFLFSSSLLFLLFNLIWFEWRICNHKTALSILKRYFYFGASCIHVTAPAYKKVPLPFIIFLCHPFPFPFISSSLCWKTYTPPLPFLVFTQTSPAFFLLFFSPSFLLLFSIPNICKGICVL